MKRLAIDTCVNYLARTISQSDFRVKRNGKYVKDELYYRLNVRPNVNQTASTFWQEVIHNLIWHNSALIIQTDTEDLLVATSFDHTQYAIFEDTFNNVTVKDYTFKRVFKQSEVLHLKYTHKDLQPFLDSLHKDYESLFARTLESQKRKNQIRSTVNIEAVTAKSADGMQGVQDFIDRMYKAFGERDIAVIPQTHGFEYKEHFSGSGNSTLPVDEIDKVTDGFFTQVARALNIPIALIRGDVAGVENINKNYLSYTINPLLKKINDEANVKFIGKDDFIKGDCIDITTISFETLFDLADKIDKLRASGIVTGNEIRVRLGLDPVDIPEMDYYFITKNYQELTRIEGGEK